MPCPLCQNYETTVIKAKTKDYYLCRHCQLIYLYPGQRPRPAEEKQRYLKHRNSLDNEGYVSFLTDFLTRGVDPFIQGGTALDYGSGPQPVLQKLLVDRGFATDIYDPFFAPKKPAKNKKYDLITCTEVLEHIFQPAKAWEYFTRHLVPGGYLAIMTYFHPGPDKFPTWWYRQDYTHVCFYNLHTFSRVLKKYPFDLKSNNTKDTIVLKRQ